MSAILGYVSVLRTSAEGVREQFSKAGEAAQRIARSSAGMQDAVDLSPEAVARAAARGGEVAAGIEKPMVDLRVAKYSAIANMRVITMADQMAKSVLEVADQNPRQGRR